MIIPNLCIAANAELSVNPVPITVVEDDGGDIVAVCTIKAGERCVASALCDLANIKERVIAQPGSPEADRYPICIYSKEGRGY
jgi:hypothetical protein